MADAQILVAKHGDVAQMRVIGRATFKISQETREFCLRSISRGIKHLIVDFSDCQAMDSTFMGVLAMVGLESRGKCSVLFVNTTPHHRDLLEGLGVARLFKFAKEPVPAVDFTSLCSAAEHVTDMSQVAGTVLEAHKTLMQIDPANVPKFKGVVEMLALDIEHLKKEGDTRP